MWTSVDHYIFFSPRGLDSNAELRQPLYNDEFKSVQVEGTAFRWIEKYEEPSVAQFRLSFWGTDEPAMLLRSLSRGLSFSCIATLGTVTSEKQKQPLLYSKLEKGRKTWF